ncbi:putative oxidoreductase major subunit [Escherichia coli]|uniref:Putative oxidoreductase major subunit n=1 Tax=Escherichia coli TaxID=562 RepID=A0A2X1N8W2_ECOLX|nr:putative oxidoreductase major subunit [Escherichia coli]
MKAEISRRSLMKTSALGSLALASSAFTLPFSQMVRAAEAPVEEKAVWSSCTVNCGSRCLLRLHVKDDTVYWVESDTTGDDVYGNHQVRACLRGRSIRRRMNHPDRLKYPMKRVGKRGEGKFERISWDEALDTISDNLRRILKDYGNEAVHVLYGNRRRWRKHHQLKRPVPSDELLRWFSQSLWQLQYRTDQCRNELYVRCQ